MSRKTNKQGFIDLILDEKRIRRWFHKLVKSGMKHDDLIKFFKAVTGISLSIRSLEQWKKENAHALAKGVYQRKTIKSLLFKLGLEDSGSGIALSECTAKEAVDAIYLITGHEFHIKTVRIWRNKIRNEQKTN